MKYLGYSHPANGFSCRHQISEGVQRSSVHLAVLLDEALPV